MRRSTSPLQNSTRSHQHPNFNPRAFSPPLRHDQRRGPFRRVVNGCVDIGAFELQRGDDED
jgi:hypothetical protein